MKLYLTYALLPALVALTLLGACAGPESAQQTEEAVMVRHDSLMVQTGQLFELKKKVLAANPAEAGPYLRGLQAADNAMMGWMHQYRVPDSTLAEPQRLAYFKQQQQLLAAVGRQQRGIIDSVSALLQQHPAATPVN